MSIFCQTPGAPAEAVDSARLSGGGASVGFSVSEVTIGEALDALKSREVRAREIAEAYLERIESIDRAGPCLNSLVTVADDVAERADELDDHVAREGCVVGPLHGIPIVVKDQIETAGMATSFGSDALRDYVPAQDATVVTRLRAAGAIVMAKSSMPDFATSWFSQSSRSGVTRNPYDVDRDAGGSSSGSAVAVSANLSLAAVGGDTGGSIRLPASFTSVVGVRPTPGLVSRDGMSAFVAPQDTAGPMARTVMDAAKMLDVMVGYDDRDAGSLLYGTRRHSDCVSRYEQTTPRVGILTQLQASDATPVGRSVNRIMDHVADSLSEAGLVVVDVEIERISELVEESSILPSRAHHDINAFLASRPGLDVDSLAAVAERSDTTVWPALLSAIIGFPHDPAEDRSYEARLRARSELYARITAALEDQQLDALICPTAQLPAPTYEEIAAGEWERGQSAMNTLLASQLLLPAVSVPGGFTQDGLPIGVDILGAALSEPHLLTVARYLEVGLGARKPPAASI